MVHGPWSLVTTTHRGKPALRFDSIGSREIRFGVGEAPFPLSPQTPGDLAWHSACGTTLSWRHASPGPQPAGAPGLTSTRDRCNDTECMIEESGQSPLAGSGCTEARSGPHPTIRHRTRQVVREAYAAWSSSKPVVRQLAAHVQGPIPYLEAPYRLPRFTVFGAKLCCFPTRRPDRPLAS